jgi:hypothetical protein
MNQPKSVEERLEGLGWQEVTEREKAILQRQGAEGANDLYKAFEHETMGTVYCYSYKEAAAFLEQLKAHPIEEDEEEVNLPSDEEQVNYEYEMLEKKMQGILLQEIVEEAKCILHEKSEGDNK